MEPVFYYLHRDDTSGLVTIRLGVVLCVEGLQKGIDLIGEASGMQGAEVKAEIVQDKLQFHLDGVG